MGKRQNDPGDVDRLFFGSLALCTAIGVGALVWHLRIPDMMMAYLSSENFKDDFVRRVKQLAGLDVTFGKIESASGLGFALSDVRIRSPDGQGVNCRIERVQGELGRDLKLVDVRSLRLTRPVCQITVDSSMRPTWRPEVANVGAGDLKLFLGARLRGVSLEDAEFRLVEARGAGWREAAHIAHVDLDLEGDADVQGVNVTAEARGNEATRVAGAMVGGASEVGFTGWLKADYPRSGELRVTADAKVSEVAGTKHGGFAALPFSFALDAGQEPGGKTRFDRLELSTPHLKAVLRGVAVNGASDDTVAAEFSTPAVTVFYNGKNNLVVRDVTFAVDGAMHGGKVELAVRAQAADAKVGSMTLARGVDADAQWELSGDGRIGIKKMRLAAANEQTRLSLFGTVDARTSPPTVDLTGDFRQSLAAFDFGAVNVNGSVDGSVKLRMDKDGALTVEGMAAVDVPEAREASLVVQDFLAEVPFRFEVTQADRLATWLDAANPDQLLDRYFATAKAFDLTARGSVGLVTFKPQGSLRSEVQLADVRLDSTYRLVASTGRTELWGKAFSDSVVAPPLAGGPILDTKYKVGADFAYHQDNGGSVDIALDVGDKQNRIAVTRADATVRTAERALSVDYRVHGPLLALLAKTAGLDMLVKHESADVSGQLRFEQLINKVDRKSWAYLPVNFPYQGDVAGSGRFELTGIDYDNLEGVRRVTLPRLAGTFAHSGGAGLKVSAETDPTEASLVLDNGTEYSVSGFTTGVQASFQTPFPSASASFQIEVRGRELANVTTGARFPGLKLSSVFDVQKAQSVNVAAFDLSLAGDQIATGSGQVAGFYPLAGVDLRADVRFDTKKFHGLTYLSDDLGEVRMPLRLSSGDGRSLRLVGSVLRKNEENVGTSAAPRMFPVEVEWTVADDNHIETQGESLQEALPTEFYDLNSLKTAH